MDLPEDRRDRVFDQPTKGRVEPFEFNETVAHVFDDMAERSIPHYREVQRLIATLIRTYYQKGTNLYDLGCSTGTTLALAAQSLIETGLQDFSLIGVDSSQAMCNEARGKIDTLKIPRDNVEILNEDLLETSLDNPSVVVMNYTLQFVKPMLRETLVERIYKNLNHNGVLLVSDKLLQSHTDISRHFVDQYYAFKRSNGYSGLEISQKREALENVLIPYSLKEEENLFRECGFQAVDIFFSWFNFTSFICLKKGS
ncbi:MAG: carboxy-S-adenosyl-L-methionine synthase CmoA [Spirochaetaceae bacterium]|nr:carboxy-S-adenosyl-L-methionine synthase CmoA [Spirochaetaceae bacterium]